MIKWLLSHQFKQSVRSVIWQRNLAANILIGILLSLFALNLLSIGLFVDRIFEELYPGKDPIELFNSFLIYYFFTDLVVRFIFQGIPALSLRSYLTLPVKRAALIHYLLLRSAKSVFNVLPLLVVLPFAFKIIIGSHTPVIAFAWLSAVFLFILCNSFLNFYLKKLVIAKPQVVVVSIATFAGLILLDVYHVVELSRYSAAIFGRFIRYPALLVLPLAILALLYYLNYWLLRSRVYLDDLQGYTAQKGRDLGDFSFLGRFGEVGRYISLELKLLLRNKRSKATLTFALFVLLFGIVFYGQVPFDEDFYPVPDVSSIPVTDDDRTADDAEVTFIVIPHQLPENAHVHITGNHDKLGTWRPEKTPFIEESADRWRRSFSFPRGYDLHYKVTLGSWQTERLTEEGGIPDAYRLTVGNDTTVVIHTDAWNTPKRHFIFEFNIIYIGLLLTGSLLIMYGQFLFSWESSYFETILSKHVDLYNYIKAKYIIMLCMGVLCYLLTLPFAFFHINILYINTALTLYNVGINTFVLLYLASYSRKRLDLSGSLFGTQGKGAGQYLTIVPTLLLPVVFMVIFLLAGLSAYLYFLFAALGIFGLLLHNRLLKFTVNQLKNQKYKIVMGYRNS